VKAGTDVITAVTIDARVAFSYIGWTPIVAS